MLTLVVLGVLVPLALWYGFNWFVGAVVETPEKKRPAAPPERITKEEQRQLDRIINKGSP